jgi:hypothetical protein
MIQLLLTSPEKAPAYRLLLPNVAAKRGRGYLCFTKARVRLQNSVIYGLFSVADGTPPILADLPGSHAEWLIVSYLSYAL